MFADNTSGAKLKERRGPPSYQKSFEIYFLAENRTTRLSCAIP